MTNSLKKIELPVYKASYGLLLYSFKLIKNLTREYKYTIGEKIKKVMLYMKLVRLVQELPRGIATILIWQDASPPWLHRGGNYANANSNNGW